MKMNSRNLITDYEAYRTAHNYFIDGHAVIANLFLRKAYGR
ncbi:Uncharacterised protein [Klebsiella pneumoniae]|uniref:Uncharacterized protein n=1 Tax=Klebsiella pneumoniae TaxID=573 RepID=A0A2X1PQJ3_KLEPN|nr:Uncharacterised protein [Klebsiella pneumoniae]SQC19936.1 Uncharacterised protein [Klebsiella pneumoniae]SQC88118.1 Uncharacterised protein [Klebsiella pneumoniae]STR75197.1 Uncharacterised protein [Klebsiella pneumoniae]STR82229.1 Uncharacterised protein [Klebsiella pneumoniae]